MYLAGYIEQLGTGIEEMYKRLEEHGLPEPKFVQEHEFKVIVARPTPQDTMHDTMHDTMQVKNEIKELILILSKQCQINQQVNIRNTV